MNTRSPAARNVRNASEKKLSKKKWFDGQCSYVAVDRSKKAGYTAPRKRAGCQNCIHSKMESYGTFKCIRNDLIVQKLGICYNHTRVASVRPEDQQPPAGEHSGTAPWHSPLDRVEHLELASTPVLKAFPV